MHWKEPNHFLTVYPSFVILLALLIWLDKGTITAIFLVSVLLHEAGHLLALRLLQVKVYSMELRASGAILHTQPASAGKEALVTAAGPTVNLLLLAVSFHRLPSAALVNLLLLGYNLIPIYPLDGGRLLRLLLCRVVGQPAGERWSEAVSTGLTVLASAAAIVLTCLFHAGLYPCLFAVLFLVRQANSPCKMRVKRLK